MRVPLRLAQWEPCKDEDRNVATAGELSTTAITLAASVGEKSGLVLAVLHRMDCYATAAVAALERYATIARILLVILLQSSRSTFSRGSLLSFFAFKESMLGTPISVLGG